MKLSELKSAKVIEDPGEIAAALTKAHASNPSLASGVRLDKKQQLVVFKRCTNVSLRAGETPPVPTREALIELATRRGFPNPDAIIERIIPYWASDERVDGHGDIVMQDWDFTEYEKSPILASSHHWEDPPIGGSLDWKVVNRVENDYDGPALWLLTFFASSEMYPWADTIYRLAKSRIMRGGSVGFYSRKVIDITDQDEREALGLGRFGYVLANNMLVEFSPTTVGANAGALSVYNNAKAKGLLVPDDAPIIRELVRREAHITGSKDLWKNTDLNIRAFLNTVFPGIGLKAHGDFDAPLCTMSNRTSGPELRTSAPLKQELKGLEELEAKFDQFSANLMDLLSGMVSTVEDVRSMVESLLPDEAVDTEPASAGKSQGSYLKRLTAHLSG